MELRMGLWLLASIALGAGIYFWHKRKMGATEQVGLSEDYSSLTLYFDPIKGEGHLFIGGTLVIITFSLFNYELAKMIATLIGINS